MKSITINIKNDELADKLISLFKLMESEGFEVSSIEEMNDLQLVKETRGEESFSLNSLKKSN